MLTRAKSFGSLTLFLFLIVTPVVFWHRSLASDLQLALTGEAYTYILLILPLSLTLIYVENRKSRHPLEPNWKIGSIVIVAAVLLRVISGWGAFHLSTSINFSLSIGALVVFWIGSVIACFGLNIFREHLFPLCFLVLIVPLPDHALTWVTEFLQQQSAWATTILFRATGVPVARDGIMLSIPGLDIEVAQECSSIRSSTILIVITLVLAHLFLHTWSRKTLLVMAAIPLSVAKNAVRIFTITELGTRVNQSFLDGRLHHSGGIVFLALALFAVFGLLWILRKGEKNQAEIPLVSSHRPRLTH
jgi:exosortase